MRNCTEVRWRRSFYGEVGVGAAGWKNGKAFGLVGVVLVILVQGCSSGGMAQSGGGGGAEGPSMQGAAGGAQVAAVGEARPVTEVVEGFDRMVVKTAELGLRVENVRGSAAEAREVSARFGGDVLNSQVYGGSGHVSADLALSVPSGEFEEALDELRGLGDRVTTDSVEGQDVTEEFVDLESRERNLLAAEESLLTLYEKAESVDDTLEVEQELTDIRGEIEQVQGRIRYLERRTSSSEIVLHLEPVTSAAPQKAWSATLVAARAWDASLLVLQTAATAIISAVVFSWWLSPALVVAGLIWWRRNRPAPSDTSS